MTREEAYEYWRFKYEMAKDFDDPRWKGGEIREIRRYVDALTTIVKMLEPPTTNADKYFRNATDEELAKFFAPGDRGCPPHRNFPCDCERGCGNCWLSWLKSPVEEET